jgi:hypothetical protein
MIPDTEPGIFICSEKFKKPRKRKKEIQKRRKPPALPFLQETAESN